MSFIVADPTFSFRGKLADRLRFLQYFPLPACNMNHTRGLISSAQALRQIFITPVRSSRVGFLASKPLQNAPQTRFFQQSRCLELRGYRPPVEKPPINEAIRSSFVQVVNDEGDLDPPTRLEDVLESFNHSEFFLLQVQEGDHDNPPVCKLYNKKEVRELEKAKAKSARSSKITLKQIELNWAIDAHDLSHRLKQLSTFLEKGRRVEILLTTKKRKRKPTVDEIKQVMQSVLDTIREAGGTQTKAMEGEPGKQLKITAQKNI
jgi:translation initiation factor IF-3